MLPRNPTLIRIFVTEVEHLGQGIQESNKKNLWKTAFKTFEVIWSSANIIWSIL